MSDGTDLSLSSELDVPLVGDPAGADESKAQGGAASLTAIDERLDYLTGLFQRRLASDKEHRRQLDDLHERLRTAEEQATVTAMLPLANDIFLVVDRMDRYDGSDGEFVQSAADELIESLRRSGFVEIDAGPEFNPAHDQVAERVEDASASEPVVIEQVRRGFSIFGRVVRPRQVVVRVPAAVPAES